MEKPLTDSPRYNAFIRGRDKALEHIFNNYRNAITVHTQKAFTDALTVIAANFHKVPREDAFTHRSRHVLQLIEGSIQAIFDMAAVHIWEEVKAMRRASYILARAGEAEAIARSLGTPTKGRIERHMIDAVENEESPAGGPFLARIQFYFARVRRDLITALEQSIIQGEDQATALKRVYREFPRRKIVRRTPKLLKNPKDNITEASRFFPPFSGVGRGGPANDDSPITPLTPPSKVTFGAGYIDEKDWENVLSAYKNDLIKTNRGPEAVLGYVTSDQGKETQVLYEWELERDVMQSFVEDVRSGQIDAATSAGIIEFVWIAVLDDKTDECCVWRDGLTTSEIETELGGSHKDDECQATTPPAHFNCRCTLAPVTDELPDSPPSNEGDFDSWLNS